MCDFKEDPWRENEVRVEEHEVGRYKRTSTLQQETIAANTS
jgi:hypothetical protein